MERAANLLIRCLEKEGVTTIFGLPGEETIDLMDALRDSSIRFVLARHEQAAAFMADGYGRITGAAGVCLSTLGPGATNLVTGIADAFLDRSPLVAITAQQELKHSPTESHQYIDIPQLLKPITKWNARVEHPRQIPEVVRKAFKIAQFEKPGATHIELPADVAAAQAEGRPIPAERTRRPSPDRPSIERAAAILAGAERPLILAGNGVIRGHAAAELTAFAESLQIPVAQTMMAKGSIPASSPMCLFTLGIPAFDFPAIGFDMADLVFCVGYDLVEYDPGYWNPDGAKQVIHLDFTPAEVSRAYIPEVEIVADLRESIQLLRERLSGVRKSDATVATRRARLEAAFGKEGDPVPGRCKPQRILRRLRAGLGPESILVSDTGAHKLWIGRLFHAERPNTVVIPNGLAPMGFAVPAGIAIRLAQPERTVVTVSGDGGFLMNAHELETARREELPTVNIVFRDEGLGSIRWKEQARVGRTFGTEFGNPDFVRFAESFGLKAFRVQSENEFDSVLQEAIGLPTPSVIDVPVDYSDDPFAPL
ncbi:MAG: acetolactate synthase large subunit [Thermoplasmata archaeon]